jgi:hypothetical protein
MNNAGFYKKDETQILFAPNIVDGPGYMLVVADKDSYEYPVDGWIWADSLDDAIQMFVENGNIHSNPLVSKGYQVEPEGFVLGLAESDRNAFTQMLTLVQEALSLGLISNDTSQVIADKSGAKHSITTLRFRQIMLGYGMYYKSLWDQLSS